MTRILVLLFVLVAPVLADRAYLKERDAPKAIFPAAAVADRKTLELTDDQLVVLGKLLGRTIEAKSYPYLAVRDDHGTALGTIFLLDVTGQTEPITFAVGVAARWHAARRCR